MKNKTILISGASSEIGLDLIRRIARPEVCILAHYHTSDKALRALKENNSINLIPLQADLGSERDIARLWEETQNYAECPDAFVHLAAPKVSQIRFKDLKWQDIQSNFDIQYKSAYHLLLGMLPKMASRGSGKIIFMLSSVTLNVPPMAMAHYTSTKFALLGLMRALASEYREKKININAISPSMVETKFLENIPRLAVELSADSHPLKRNAKPADISPVIQFLLSPEADFIFGANIPVTGGESF